MRPQRAGRARPGRISSRGFQALFWSDMPSLQNGEILISKKTPPAAENRADPVADLDDELFGMVDKRKITPKPKAATVTEKEKVKPSDDSKGGTFGGRGKDKISVPMEVEETPEGIVLYYAVSYTHLRAHETDQYL
eukprot:1296599-Amorphochlora_amoeboformis.AAC.1